LFEEIFQDVVIEVKEVTLKVVDGKVVVDFVLIYKMDIAIDKVDLEAIIQKVLRLDFTIIEYPEGVENIELANEFEVECMYSFYFEKIIN
jgi:hypothetical protein